MNSITLAFYVLTDNYEYSFHVCLDCYKNNDTEKYEETPQYYSVSLDYYPSCEWCNEKIKEGVKLI